jgi:hypothetical protein
MSRDVVPQVNVKFDDPGGLFTVHQERQMTHAITVAIRLDAADLLVHAGATINLMVHADPFIAETASSPSAWGPTAIPGVLQSSAEIEINSGHQPRTSNTWQDGDIYVNPAFLSELSFNPSSASNYVVPANKVDAVALFAHESLHVLGIEGFLDQQATTTPAAASTKSNFDALVAFGPTGPTFNGASAEAQNAGEPIELTAGNLYHVGGANTLAYDLMNGDHIYTGLQYQPSALDVGILADLGYNVKPAKGGEFAISEYQTGVAGLVQAMASFPTQGNASIASSPAASTVGFSDTTVLAPNIIQHG